MKVTTPALILLLAAPAVFAEYRAYQYLVKTNAAFAVATNARAQYLTSTLNPAMYQSYHGGTYITVEFLRTWMCPGYTGLKTPICDHPYDKETPLP